ncbi:hypothetical protein FTX61_17750 [Nitriliruptoraceae bacterium ZYF776]|nr:hypothetical protein [Profundirhabdus halotolerans]
MSGRRSRGWVVLVCALVVLLAAELGVRAVASSLPPAPRFPNPFADAKLRQMEARGDVEVVLLGSSIVNAGLAVEPVARGLDRPVVDVYNAALPAAGIELWEVWQRDVVEPALDPDVVLVGVSIRDVNDTTYTAGQVEGFVASDGFALATGGGDLLTRIDAVASRWSALVRYRAVLRQPGSVLAWRRGEEVEGWPRQDIDGSGRYLGFDTDTYRPADAERFEELRDGAMADFRPWGRKRAALERTLARIRADGATPVLVRLPALHDVLVDGEVVTTADVTAFDRELAAVAGTGDTVLVDLAELDDRPELFADEYHLNGRGVAEVGDLLARRLDEAVGSVGGPVGGSGIG